MAGTSQCRSCGAAIMWAVTPSGRTMPLDAEPTANGNIVIEEDGRAATLNKVTLAEMIAAGDPTPRRTSHFATCKNSAQHRKAK